MEYRPLCINLVSAYVQKDNFMSKMDVYAAVTMNGDPRTEQRTPVDKQGDKNPSWNFPVNFIIDEATVQQNRLFIVIRLRRNGHRGQKDIGGMLLPIKPFLDTWAAAKYSPQFVSYEVKKPSGKTKGTLNFSYNFGAKFTIAVAAPVGMSAVYPPPGGFIPVPAHPPPVDYPAAFYSPPGVPHGSFSGIPPPGSGYPF